MLKKFFNRFKKKSEESKVLYDKEEVKNLNELSTIVEINVKTTESVDNLDEMINNESEEQFDEADRLYIVDAKIKRAMAIKAIDVYTNEEQIFKTHKQCSQTLKVPIEYIRENLRYGHTDYLGQAIKYLSKELRLREFNNYYINNIKNPIEIYNELNNKIFTIDIPESKVDDILSNNKIEPVKMHYKFESLDYEYDMYYKKYKDIIKRGGKKKIDLLNAKGEVIQVFKSLDECSKHLNKNKSEIINMLKYKDNKVGRYEIRYSLRNI